MRDASAGCDVKFLHDYQLSSGHIFVLSTVLMILHLGAFLGSTRITNMEM